MTLGVATASSRAAGGVIQYGLSIVDALRSGGEAFALLTGGAEEPMVDRPGVPIVPLLPPGHPRALLPVARRLLGTRVTRLLARRRDRRSASAGYPIRERPEVGHWYRTHGLDLAFWAAPRQLAFECGLPFVMAVHDLQHRLQPEFPEVSADGEWEAREYLFRNGARTAAMLVADSEQGKADILEAYGRWIGPDRVAVLPFLPPPYLAGADPERARAAARGAYPLPARYLYYPANFWPHKNHEAIVRALGLLRARGRADVQVVFSGSASGRHPARTHRATMTLARSLGVVSQLTVLPYVPDELMAGLYLASEGLVMPTFFGPSNIPVLEAWSLGVPAITSDLPGLRAQAGDAALLIDPRDPATLAEAMRQLWEDGSVRERLIAAGRSRAAAWTPALFAERLQGIVAAARRHAEADGGRRPWTA